MVIQDDPETPLEVSTMKSSLLEDKKYVIVKNHVRELPMNNPRDTKHSSAEENNLKTEKKAKKLSKRNVNAIQEGIESSDTNEISESDLEELRTVYNQCKSVLNRIESKYGHLLNLQDGASTSKQHNLKEENFDKQCNCKANKKIIFDDDGEQLVKEPVFYSHICAKNLKRRHSDYEPAAQNQNLAVEYEEHNITLPDDLKTLSNILQDTDIAISYRNKVINKMKLIKLEQSNEIKFNRSALVKQLKSNPESAEIFEFKGANLATIPGYPDFK